MSRNVSTCRSGRTSRWTGALGLMSSIATKPSAAWTWFPSRTSLQKRQSGCEANDSLLGQVDGAHSDERALPRVYQPRRVVVAVPAARAIDENGLLAAELSRPSAPARLGGQSPEPGASRFLHSGRDSIVVCRARSGPRRIREHVNLRHARLVDRSQRVLERSFVLCRKADDHVGGEIETRRL